MIASHETQFARRHQGLFGAIADNAAAQDHADGTLKQDFKRLHDAGWLKACLPKSFGGEGWANAWPGLSDAIEALRLLGYANLSTARLFEGHMNAVKLVELYGTSELVERVAQNVSAGAVLGVWGANLPGQPVSLVKSDQTLSLRGTKQFASGLELVSHAVVSAEAADLNGTQLMIAPAGDTERQKKDFWRMAGMQATQSGHYSFDGVTARPEEFLGDVDDYFREPFFEGGIWRYCAAHIGGAEAIYDTWRSHLIDRSRADDPIQRSRLVEAAEALGTANLWIERAAKSVEHPDALANSATTALTARNITEAACLKVLTLAEMAMGMVAHERGSLVERTRRDLRLYLCQAAPDAKRQRIADTLLKDSRCGETESP